MSCDHCRHAIESEVGRVPGVTAVEVDLPAKLVTVRGDAPDERAVRAAIDEAGYEVS
jgi:copper ion binding protein